MAWKKARLQEIRDKLKHKFGLSDSKIKTLKSYGSIEHALDDLVTALGKAGAAEIKAQLKMRIFGDAVATLHLVDTVIADRGPHLVRMKFYLLDIQFRDQRQQCLMMRTYLGITFRCKFRLFFAKWKLTAS